MTIGRRVDPKVKSPSVIFLLTDMDLPLPGCRGSVGLVKPLDLDRHHLVLFKIPSAGSVRDQYR